LSQPSILIVDSDLSTPVMVEASCDATQIAVHSTRDIAAARHLLEEEDFDAVMLAGELPDAAELLVELLGSTILWLGSPDEPGAEMASAVIPKPLDIVSLQLALEEHLNVAQPGASLAEESGANEGGEARLLSVEAERDALRAELSVLRHERGQEKRQAEALSGAALEGLDAQLASSKEKLAGALRALDTQRKTAEALQTAYGEVEQAHGKLLQSYEALEAERDALAERARHVSNLQEKLEIARREKRELEARLSDTVIRADNAERALGIRVDAQYQAEASESEVGWWQDAVKEVAEDT